MENNDCMLSTIDNPYDPYTHWDEWYAFDIGHGYHCCSVLARIAHTSPALSEADNALEISNAIDDIIKFDARHIFKKVRPKTAKRN